jgi:putative peptidoglycan lipid II flippase
LGLNNIFKNSILLSAGIFGGRLLGYLRELLISQRFGAGQASDTVVLALTLPELMSSILSTGVAANVLVPRLHRIDPQGIIPLLISAWAKISSLLIICFVAFSLFTYFYFPQGKVIILIWASLAILPNGMTGLIYAYLSYKERFLGQSLGNIMFNLVATLGLFLFPTIGAIVTGFILASMARFWLTWKETKGELPFSMWFRSATNALPEIQLTKRLFLVSIGGSSLQLLNPIVDRILAINLQEGAVTLLSYAEKIYMLPVSVVITPYIVASFPLLSREIEGGADIERAKIIGHLKMPFLISCIITLPIFFIPDLLIQYSFGLTGLDFENQRELAKILQAYSPTIIFSSCSLVLTNIFFSLKKERLVLVSTFISVVMNFLGDMAVVKFGGRAVHIALVTSAVSLTTFLIQTNTLLKGIQRK